MSTAQNRRFGRSNRRWDTATYQDVATRKRRQTQGMNGLEFSDDDTLVGFTDQDLNIWRAAPLSQIDAKP